MHACSVCSLFFKIIQCERAHTWDFIVQFDDVSLVSWFISFYNERSTEKKQQTHTRANFLFHSSNFLFSGLWCSFPKRMTRYAGLLCLPYCLPACLLMLTLYWCVELVWVLCLTHIFFFFIRHMVPFIRLLYFILYINIPFFCQFVDFDPMFDTCWKEKKTLQKTMWNLTCALHIFFYCCPFFFTKSQMRIECFLSKKEK